MHKNIKTLRSFPYAYVYMLYRPLSSDDTGVGFHLLMLLLTRALQLLAVS
jgi:hypothetical protein